ncbi:MAG: hypothetical protein C0506_15450 [Anaerolinea sp.]|nr:hypothetical protein [Anaerolinea sp.]
MLIPGREQPVEVQEATFGPSGGAIKLADGAALTVPAGSLSGQTLLRVERIEPGLEDFDFTVGSSAIYRVTLGDDSIHRLDSPVILDIPWEPDRTLVLSFEDGKWVSPRLASGDTVRVELDHFSTRTILAIGASLSSGLRIVGEQVAGALPRWDLRAAIQEKEAAHRKRIEGKAASTQQFFGVGETTKRTHAEICEEFKTVFLANTSNLTFNQPPGAPGVYYLTKFLGDAGRPSEGDSSAKWYWAATEASHEVIRARVIAAGQGQQISPAAVLRIAVEANGGNVPLGVLAAHNVLKDIAYSGRQLADPTETYVGSVQEVPVRDGQFVASIQAWRRTSDHSPSGRYDKMGPLYHIFAAMAARVWADALYGQAVVSVEALLRSTGWGNDIPDPEKGAADECGLDIGAWILDFVSLGFEPVTSSVEVGKEVPLTLTVRNLTEKGVSIELNVLSGEGSLSRTGVSVSKGSSTGSCDVVGTTATCGLTFTPSKAGDAVVEARSGKASATVKVASDPPITVTLNWSSRATVKFLAEPAGHPRPMALEVWGSPRGTVETLVESTAQGERIYALGSRGVGCQADSTTPAVVTFTTSQLRFGGYTGDDFFVWLDSRSLCSLFGDATLPLISWTVEIKVGDADPTVCTGSYVSRVPSVANSPEDNRRQLAARFNLLADPVVTCLGGN